MDVATLAKQLHSVKEAWIAGENEYCPGEPYVCENLLDSKWSKRLKHIPRKINGSVTEPTAEPGTDFETEPPPDEGSGLDIETESDVRPDLELDPETNLEHEQGTETDSEPGNESDFEPDLELAADTGNKTVTGKAKDEGMWDTTDLSFEEFCKKHKTVCDKISVKYIEAVEGSGTAAKEQEAEWKDFNSDILNPWLKRVKLEGLEDKETQSGLFASKSLEGLADTQLADDTAALRFLVKLNLEAAVLRKNLDKDVTNFNQTESQFNWVLAAGTGFIAMLMAIKSVCGLFRSTQAQLTTREAERDRRFVANVRDHLDTNPVRGEMQVTYQ
jgi:hypothetical protein